MGRALPASRKSSRGRSGAGSMVEARAPHPPSGHPLPAGEGNLEEMSVASSISAAWDGSGVSPSNRSTARPMSSARIRVSPTRIAETPAASSRSTSRAGPDAALADEEHLGGDPVADAEGQLQVGDEPPEVAVVDPDQVGPGGQDPGEVGLLVELDQGRHAEPSGPGEQARPAPRRRGSRRSGGPRRRRPSGPRRPGIRRSGSPCGARGSRPRPGSGPGRRGAPGSTGRRSARSGRPRRGPGRSGRWRSGRSRAG